MSRLYWAPWFGARLKKSSRGWTRTSDKTVNSRLLYQLSYAGIGCLPGEGRQKYSTSETGGVKDFAGRLGPLGQERYRTIRMMSDAAVKRVVNTLPQNVTSSLSWER